MLARWCFALIVLTACGSSQRPLLEDLSQHENLSLFKLQSVQGIRDGDRLAAQAMLSDSSSILRIDMHFAVGSPTRLESGTWQWTRTGSASSGTVSARSVTFLGGQDSPPSIGGAFDLMESGGTAHYRVNIPVTELKRQ